MKHLYVMHTQYNLILATAMLSRYPKEDEHILVLYAEFTVTGEILKALEETFSRVIVVRDRFEKEGNYWQQIRLTRKYLKSVKPLWNLSFADVYLTQERLFDSILCQRIKRVNPKAKCYHLEEDVYYSVDNARNQPNYSVPTSFQSECARLLRHILLAGYPYRDNEPHYCYGMSSMYDGVNLLFPAVARREVQSKPLTEIHREGLVQGIFALYGKRKIDYPLSAKYCVFFCDLINRYVNREAVRQAISRLIKQAQNEGRQVLVKYHPRETEKLDDFPDLFEINKHIPAEKVLLDMLGKDVTVLGNATTACVVAAKLGYTVYSVCKLETPQNHAMHTALTQMGVHCIDNSQMEMLEESL